MGKSDKIDASYTQNRELSWLKFNERVLDEASDALVPLYERLKFAAIFTSNLDEFFMVRVGSLYDLSLVKKNKFDNKSFMTPSDQLAKIFAAAAKLYKKRDDIFAVIDKALRAENIARVGARKMDADELKFIEQYFDRQVAPILSPQIIDLQHPFPHLTNKALYIAVMLKHKKKTTLGVIPVPRALPKLLYLPGNKQRYILMEKIILEFVYKVFAMYSIIDKAVVCITRNADISPDDEAPEVGEDYLHHMKKTLKKRQRLAPVRLEIETSGDSLMIDYLAKRLNIKTEQIYITKAPINLSYAFSLPERFSEKQKNSLLYPPFEPSRRSDVPEGQRILDAALRRDILFHYPYQSFDLFLQFMKEAVYDESVLSIKITIYRMGSKKTKLMNYLIAAAEMGKEVTVLMELRARFDEENNINWAEALSEAGCKIIFGFEGYKVHSKICLITRKVGDQIQYLTQIGTGNYNAQTAGVYTDYCLLTANEAIGRDAAAFFKNMGIANLNGEYEELLVAPVNLKSRLLALIRREIDAAKANKPARIVLKMNSLTDRQLIDALAAASKAGVNVRLIVRGICCLLPKVPKKTDNISVVSIVGRFLEHSRVYCFGVGDDTRMYIASADWMTRNTENRVEIACPILDPAIRRRIENELNLMLLDSVKGRELQKNGEYRLRDELAEKLNSQERLAVQYQTDPA